jgi:DNA-binding MarR family transcriptional regulator
MISLELDKGQIRVYTLNMKKPSRCLCINFRQAARDVTQFYDSTLAPSGLKVTQFSLLTAVARSGSTSISKLAEKKNLDRTTLGRNLAILERDGLIEFGPSEDQRERNVSLTARGKQALDSAMPFWEHAQEKVRRILGEKGVQQIKDLLGKLEELK